MGAVAAGAARQLSASSRATCSSVGPPGAPPDPAEIDVLLRELMQADEAPSVSTFIEREATRAGARVHDPPLGVSAQGGRSALVGAAAAVGEAEGGDGGDPGRRVRQRPRGRDPRRAVRSRDGRGRAGLDLRRLSGPDPGRDARDGEPDVAVRAAPAPARRDRRPPRAVRDDLLGAQPALRDRAAAARATTATRACSSTSTSSPTPCTRASPRSTSPAGWPRRTRAGRRHPVGRARAAGDRRPLGAAHDGGMGGRRVLAAPRRWRCGDRRRSCARSSTPRSR